MKKNSIILYTGIGLNKTRVELFNFNVIDHIAINGITHIRIECGGRYYYYQESITHISMIECY